MSGAASALTPSFAEASQSLERNFLSRASVAAAAALPLMQMWKVNRALTGGEGDDGGGLGDDGGGHKKTEAAARGMARVEGATEVAATAAGSPGERAQTPCPAQSFQSALH